VVATVEVPGSGDKGFEGLTMSITPSGGTGPFYFDADSTPNANRTETSTWSAAVFANVGQGVAEITLGPRAGTCVPKNGLGFARGQPSTRSHLSRLRNARSNAMQPVT
jgi:hypothetical protein